MTEGNIKPKSLLINQESNPNFFEEFETEKVTIVHKIFDNKRISMMTFNLFLKKIVTTNFYKSMLLFYKKRCSF